MVPGPPLCSSRPPQLSHRPDPDPDPGVGGPLRGGRGDRVREERPRVAGRPAQVDPRRRREGGGGRNGHLGAGGAGHQQVGTGGGGGGGEAQDLRHPQKKIIRHNHTLFFFLSRGEPGHVLMRPCRVRGSCGDALVFSDGRVTLQLRRTVRFKCQDYFRRGRSIWDEFT